MYAFFASLPSRFINDERSWLCRKLLVNAKRVNEVHQATLISSGTFIMIKILPRYRSEYLMFNDDIQGTAATVLAGLYGAMKVQGLGPEALKNQKFVVCGAGSAGSGVLLTIRNAITRSA